MTSSSTAQPEAAQVDRRPGVAVIIPTFNYARFVARAVQSVLDQTFPPAEVIVVDDGSTDETPDVLATFGSRIRVIRQENRGVSAARNLGVEDASAPLVAFLDADDAWLPRKLEAQVAALQAHPGAGLVHCGVQDVDEDGRVLRRNTEGGEGWVAGDLLMMKPVVHAPSCSMLIPRRVFDEAGGFDERLSTSADWDLCVRIAARLPFAFVPEVLLSYTIHRSAMHLNVGKMEHDMLLAMEKAFALHPQAFGGIRREAMANLFMVLGGSYFTVGELRHAARCILKSVSLQPRKVLHVLDYPARTLRRRGERARATRTGAVATSSSAKT